MLLGFAIRGQSELSILSKEEVSGAIAETGAVRRLLQELLEGSLQRGIDPDTVSR